MNTTRIWYRYLPANVGNGMHYNSIKGEYDSGETEYFFIDSITPFTKDNFGLLLIAETIAEDFISRESIPIRGFGFLNFAVYSKIGDAPSFVMSAKYEVKLDEIFIL